MNILAQLRKKAATLGKTIVLPEGDDKRTLQAAEIILKEKIAKLIIIGDKKAVSAHLTNAGLTDNWTVADPLSDPRLEQYTRLYYEKRKIKGDSMESAAQAMKNPLFFGSMLVQQGVADGCVAGAVHTTADVLRAGLRVVGTQKGVTTVSSFFIIAGPNKNIGTNGVFLFADCAVNPEPTAEMLVDIAVSTADNCRKLLGIEPRVALLSFSTKGSAVTESSQKVAEAAHILKQKAPDLISDGEMQLDAAIIPEISGKKAPGSPLGGRANVLVFPNLDAANIGYKLVERFAGAQAVGPIVQGYAKPVNDLSRGASFEDIINTVAITVIQTQ